MMVLVSYDVSTTTPEGRRRLRKTAETCLNYGIRVQHSVFECQVTPVQWEKLRSRLLSIYDEKEDSLRFYFLGANWKRRVEHHGMGPSGDLDEPMII